MKYIKKYIWCLLLSGTHASHVGLQNVGVCYYSHYISIKGSPSLIISLTRPRVFLNTENSRPALLIPGTEEAHIVQPMLVQ